MTASTEMIKATEGDSALAVYNNEQMDQLRNFLAPGLEDSELAFFCAVAKQKGLDPFKKQVYAVKRRQNLKKQVNGKWADNWVSKIDVLTGIDGYRAIAARARDYAPGDETIVMNGDMPFSATVSVRKLVQGTWQTFSATAYFDEYAVWYVDKVTNKRTLGDKWATMPKRMITKCAEALALRKGWPEEIGDVRVSEEFDRVLSEGSEASSSRFGGAIPPETKVIEASNVVQLPPPAEEPKQKTAAKAEPKKEAAGLKWDTSKKIPDKIIKSLPKHVQTLAGTPVNEMEPDDLDLLLEEGKKAYSSWSAMAVASPGSVSPRALEVLQDVVVGVQLQLDKHQGLVPPADDTPPPTDADMAEGA